MSDLNKDYRPFLDSLDSLGFCTFRLLGDDTIDSLKTLYHSQFADQNIDGLYASHNSGKVEKGLAISHAIRDIISESIKPVFPEFDYFLGHFMVKGANVKTEFSLHQDWNIVEETRHKSYQVWIPLQLTTEANGGMFVVPGSHLFFNNYRSGSYTIPFVPYEPEIAPIVTSLTVPAGNVLIYHNALFHASHPNQTDQIRIAVIANFVEKAAKTYFFHKSNGKTELYPITGDSLITHLPNLEKGITDPTMNQEREVDISPIENSSIGAKDLVSCYKDTFSETPAAQVKQLHITRDKELEAEINDRGYTVLNLLQEQEVDTLLHKYQQQFGNIDRTPGRFTTLQHTDARVKRDIHNYIVQHVDQAMKRHFIDYDIPVSQYYTKKAHTSGDIDLHADSTLLVNHQLEPHYAIWIPLQDVDPENGCLTVVPFSHRNQRAFYGGSFTGRQYDHRDWLREYEIPIPLKAGQAIVFDNNLLHSSTANSTNRDRICLTYRVTHCASDYYSFICRDKTSPDLDLYLETHQYYMDEKWDGEGQHLSGKYMGTMHQAIVDLTAEELVPMPKMPIV